jgi:hypothetical protein
MNSKLLNNQEVKLKIDNLKNINISEIIKKKKYKGFREGKDIQIFNHKQKHQNSKLNNFCVNKNLKEYDYTISRITTNQINKNSKIGKLSIDLFDGKPYKLKENLLNNKIRKKNLHSNRRFYPKKYLKMISFLTEDIYKNIKRKIYSYNKSKKEQMNIFKKIFNGKKPSVYDGGIPLMTFEKSKRKKLGNKTLKEKSIKNTNVISNNKNQNISFNRGNCSNNNIVSKPQCLYKGPLKYDISVGEEDDSIPQNNHSLFKAFMSRNLKPSKPESNNHIGESMIKDSQACTFIRYDFNGTMKTKRIFNSTFHILDNNKNDYLNKEIVTTINSNLVGGNNNKKKRTFGGIMLNKAKLF